MRAQIPFLKDMDGQTQALGDGDGLGVNRAGVAVKHQVGDAVAGDDLAKCVGPGVGRALERDVVTRAGPERPVAPVEADAPDLCPGGGQHLAQAVKEGPVRPLQEQKDVVLTGAVHVHPRIRPALVGVRPVKVKRKTCDLLTVRRPEAANLRQIRRLPVARQGIYPWRHNLARCGMIGHIGGPSVERGRAYGVGIAGKRRARRCCRPCRSRLRTRSNARRTLGSTTGPMPRSGRQPGMMSWHSCFRPTPCGSGPSGCGCRRRGRAN